MIFLFSIFYVCNIEHLLTIHFYPWKVPTWLNSFYGIWSTVFIKYIIGQYLIIKLITIVSLVKILLNYRCISTSLQIVFENTSRRKFLITNTRYVFKHSYLPLIVKLFNQQSSSSSYKIRTLHVDYKNSYYNLKSNFSIDHAGQVKVNFKLYK